MIKYIISAISFLIIGIVTKELHTKNEINNSDSSNYTVTIPLLLLAVFKVLFGLGLVMFLIFFLVMLTGNPTVTTGHIVMTTVIMGIGMFGILWSTKWKLVVHNEKMIFSSFLHKEKEFLITDISKVEVQTKQTQNGIVERIILHFSTNNSTIKIEDSCDNYELLMNTLKSYNKLD